MQTISSIFSFFKRNPFVLFVLLAYLISWSVVRRTGGWIISWGPMLADLIVLGLTQGRKSVKAWRRQVTQRRPGGGPGRGYGPHRLAPAADKDCGPARLATC